MNYPSVAWHVIGRLEPSFAEVTFSPIRRSRESTRYRTLRFEMSSCWLDGEAMTPASYRPQWRLWLDTNVRRAGMSVDTGSVASGLKIWRLACRIDSETRVK